jgi:hypothetical protein
VGVEYRVSGKTYVTNQESKNTVSSKCNSKDNPYRQELLPKLGEYHPVWYDGNNVKIAMLTNTLPIAWSLGLFTSIVIAVGFVIFFKRKFSTLT